jgi:hypothetical protein
MLESHLRQVATAVLQSAIRIAPPEMREWGQAMRAELSHVEGPWAALMWALGGASILAKHALASLLTPGRRQSAIPSHQSLFAQEGSMRKATFIASVACVVGAVLFFFTPVFRQAFRASLAPWYEVFHVTSLPAWRGQSGLKGLAQRAEAQQDPEGLAFVAARLDDDRESARLAEEAVRLNPKLIWVYAVVAVHHPHLPQMSQWLGKLECWDPQNALFHLIEVESIDNEIIGKASRLSPKEEENQLEGDPGRERGLAAAFASPRFDDYLGRLRELDRRVVSRYAFNEPYVVLSGEGTDLPSYAFSDSLHFAKSLLRLGEKLETQGDRKGATEKYWTVARFGQVIDSQGHTDFAHYMGLSLQAGAYKHLQTISEKEGNHEEAALFGYLARNPEPPSCPGGT